MRKSHCLSCQRTEISESSPISIPGLEDVLTDLGIRPFFQQLTIPGSCRRSQARSGNLSLRDGLRSAPIQASAFTSAMR